MKVAAEEEMGYCVEDMCNPMAKGISASGGNCSTSCEVFIDCVNYEVANRSRWQIGRNLYNKSLVARARERCFALPESIECLNIHVPNPNDPDDPPVSIDNPKRAKCLNLECYYCGQTLYSKYFTCAMDCGQACEPVMAMPSLATQLRPSLHCRT